MTVALQGIFPAAPRNLCFTSPRPTLILDVQKSVWGFVSGNGPFYNLILVQPVVVVCLHTAVLGYKSKWRHSTRGKPLALQVWGLCLCTERHGFKSHWRVLLAACCKGVTRLLCRKDTPGEMPWRIPVPQRCHKSLDIFIAPSQYEQHATSEITKFH